MANSPEHPGQPQWQSYKEWVKMKTPQSVNYIRTAEETRAETFERFGLTEEVGIGWGDASEAQDAGWGNPAGGSGENTGGW